MTKGTGVLPEGFGDLEGYVADWALDTEAERKEMRASSEMAALEDYYSCLIARVEDIAKYLDAFPMEPLDPPQQKLLNLALMFMEVSIAVEFYRQPELPGGFPRERFIIANV